MLTFLVGSKQAFEVSLADVSQTQMQGKNDVILEFHVDDTTGANEVGFLFIPVVLSEQFNLSGKVSCIWVENYLGSMSRPCFAHYMVLISGKWEIIIVHFMLLILE